LIGELEIKPKARFKRGLFRRRARGGPVEAGAMFPQAVVRAGGRMVRSDDVLGPEPCLVGIGFDPAEHIGPMLRARWVAHGGRFVRIARRGESRPAGGLTRDCEDVSAAFLSSSHALGWLAIVRPDRVVMCEGRSEDATRLVGDACALLGTPERTS
jgi:3-(3-hydroxy-phenyl)propionate hydroxylase